MFKRFNENALVNAWESFQHQLKHEKVSSSFKTLLQKFISMKELKIVSFALALS